MYETAQRVFTRCVCAQHTGFLIHFFESRIRIIESFGKTRRHTMAKKEEKTNVMRTLDQKKIAYIPHAL